MWHTDTQMDIVYLEVMQMLYKYTDRHIYRQCKLVGMGKYKTNNIEISTLYEY